MTFQGPDAAEDGLTGKTWQIVTFNVAAIRRRRIFHMHAEAAEVLLRGDIALVNGAGS
jgi:hypothetical protein